MRSRLLLLDPMSQRRAAELARKRKKRNTHKHNEREKSRFRRVQQLDLIPGPDCSSPEALSAVPKAEHAIYGVRISHPGTAQSRVACPRILSAVAATLMPIGRP